MCYAGPPDPRFNWTASGFPILGGPTEGYAGLAVVGIYSLVPPYKLVDAPVLSVYISPHWYTRAKHR